MTALELYKTLKKEAAKETNREACKDNPWGFNPADTGNFDDTYSMGIDDGEIGMARRVLPTLKQLLEELNIGPLDD